MLLARRRPPSPIGWLTGYRRWAARTASQVAIVIDRVGVVGTAIDSAIYGTDDRRGAISIGSFRRIPGRRWPSDRFRRPVVFRIHPRLAEQQRIPWNASEASCWGGRIAIRAIHDLPGVAGCWGRRGLPSFSPGGMPSSGAARPRVVAAGKTWP